MLVLAAIAALAQEPAKSSAQSQQNGSVSGTVKEERTGAPIADVTVSVYINSRFANGTIYMSPNTKEITTHTDAQGHYKLSDLPAGLYRVSARGKTILGPRGDKMVNLRPSQELTSIDFSFPAYGVITGKVLDQNKEPVPGASVYLISKQYSTGGVGYFLQGMSNADDQGDYSLKNVATGVPYLLMAAKRTLSLGFSEAPTDPKLRKQAFVPTYYPNVAEPEGAAPIALRAGERHEGVDIRLLRTPAYCIAGVLDGGTAQFIIAGSEFSGGMPAGGGMVTVTPGGKVGPDGKFRVCDLRRGTYRITAFVPPENPSAPLQFSTAQVTITDEDLTNLKLTPGLGLPIPGVVVWEGTPPDSPPESKVLISLRPLNRTPFQGESQNFMRASIPAEFSFPSVLIDDYSITASVSPPAPGVYVKNIFYGTASVLHAPLRAGSAVGNGEIRVVLARDGGSIAVKVADKDGNPVPHIRVAIMPEDVHSEAELPDRLVSGDTDQDGNYSYEVLAPGKYLVLATTMRIDRTVERIGKLWGARNQAKVVEVGPNASAQVTIEPARIE